MREPSITIEYQGNKCYSLTAKLINEGKQFYSVNFEGRIYRWPKIHATHLSGDNFVIRKTFYKAMYMQDEMKAMLKAKVELKKFIDESRKSKIIRPS